MKSEKKFKEELNERIDKVNNDFDNFYNMRDLANWARDWGRKEMIEGIKKWKNEMRATLRDYLGIDKVSGLVPITPMHIQLDKLENLKRGEVNG